MKKDKQVDITEQYMLPHDVDTEVAVLSTLMRYNDVFQNYGDLLDVNLYYYPKERNIFRCIAGVVASGGITDVNSLMEYYAKNREGMEEASLLRGDFIQLVSSVSKPTIGQDIERLHAMARRRQLWLSLQRYSQRILDYSNDIEEEAGAAVNEISEIVGDTVTSEIVSHGETLQEIRQQVLMNREGKTNCILTGFKLFDEKYILRPDTLTVIAAFTSVGKSALALNIVQNVARQGIPCAYYSLEMSRKELASRTISKQTQMTASTIMNRQLTDEQVGKLDAAISNDMNLPIYYDDHSTVDFNRTMRSVRTMVKTKGVRLVCIDYLQIYSQTDDDVEKNISYMARTAKNVAKELGIAMLVISQLNRSALHPSIKMLRGSGQIEESADNIVLIDRPDAYPDNKVTKYEGEFKDVSVKGTAKLILAKGRGVGTGSDLVAFDKEHTLFHAVEVQEAGSFHEQQEALPF